MAEPVRKRRILFDIKEGSPGDTYASIAFYEKHKKEFGQFVEAWVFDPNGTDEASLLGFFDVSPWQQNRRDHPPSAASPNFVLIDENGDQLWLSGAAIMGGTGLMEPLGSCTTQASISPRTPITLLGILLTDSLFVAVLITVVISQFWASRL